MSEDMKLFLEQEGEAPVRAPQKEGSLFLSQLSWNDLQRLRNAVKRVYLRNYPGEYCTDREADRMIESLAPSIAERLIKNVVDGTLERRDGSIAYGRLKLDE